MSSEPIDVRWMEYPCSRDFSATTFANGLQDYPFDVNTPEVFFPERTYLRGTFTVSGATAAGTAPTMEQQIALAEGCFANCYNQASFKVGNVELSSIDQFFPQASALESRVNNSGAWMDKLGSYAMSYNGDRSSRVAAISRTAGAGNLAPTGLKLNEGKEEMYRPTDGITPDLATLAGLTGTAGFTMAGGASITAADVGATLVVNGQKYTVLGIVGGLVNVGVGFSTAIAAQAGAAGPPVVPATPAVANNTIAATKEWYLVRRNIAYSTQSHNSVQVIFRPSALGIFRYKGMLGPGKYKLSLNPDPNYQNLAIEYPYSTATGYGPLTPASGAFSLAITDVKLYVCTAKMKYNIERLPLRLTEYQVQSQPMISNSQNMNWTVEGSTKTLYMFLQDVTVGNNPVVPPSVFRVYGTTTVPGTLPTGTGVEQNLTTMQVTYAGMIRPPTKPNSIGYTPSSNLLVQMYLQSLWETRRGNESGGVETFDQFLQRGPLYCFRFDRDSTSLATQVQTSVTYSPLAPASAWPPNGCNIFLVSEYYRESMLVQKDGNLLSLEAINV